MTALVCERYGEPEVLKFLDIPRPLSGKNEMLIRVVASTITSGDRRVRSLDVPRGFRTLGRLALGWRGPRQPVLGATFAGVVSAASSHAEGFVPGDAVLGINGFRMGAHAEYLCMPTKGAVVHKPGNLSFEEAAALPFGGTTALTFLRRAGVRPGEKILINGASGNVGMAALQLARIMGAEVSGVCSASHVDQVRRLGAARVIDYQRWDFTAQDQRYDVVFDVACNQTVKRCLTVLNPGGRLIRLLSNLPETGKALLLPRFDGKQVIVGTAEERADHLEYLANLVRQGQYRPVIAQIFPFDKAHEAHQYADRGNHGGSVVLKMKDHAAQADLEAASCLFS